MKKYPRYFLPESAGNMCALTCIYGIFNYFWHTAFNRKDNREMMQLMKGGSYTGKELLDIPEMAYKLERLGFNIDMYYSYNENMHKKLLENPKEIYPLLISQKYHSFIKGNMRVEEGIDKGYDFTDMFFQKKLYENSCISKKFQASLEQVVGSETSKNALYIVGLNYDILHEIKHEKNIAGGHVLIVQEIVGDNYIVHDPGPPLIPYGKFHKDIFHKALTDMGEYEFIRVSHQ